MLIAHLADTHLGKRQYHLEWREQDFYEVFTYAVEQAIREHVDAIIISGDMFDTYKPPNRAIKIARDTLKKAADKGIRIYGILGEHDTPKTRDYPPQVLVPELKLLGINEYIDTITKDGRTYTIAGIIHHPPTTSGLLLLKKKMRQVSRQTQGKALLMLHQTIINFFKLERGLEIHEIPENISYVAMGHLHWRKLYRRSNGQLIAYPGSLEITSADDIKEWKKSGKGLYIVDLSGDQAEASSIDVPVTPQEKIELEYPKHRIMLVKKIPELKKLAEKGKLIIHIVLHLPRRIDVSPETEISQIIKRELGNIEKLYITWTRKYIGEEEEKLEEQLEKQNPEEIERNVISYILADNKEPRPEHLELADTIIMLKNMLAQENYANAQEIIEELSKHHYWLTRIRLPQIRAVKATRTTTASRPQPTNRPRRPFRLDEFLRGG